jgi:zinc transporter ZupT
MTDTSIDRPASGRLARSLWLLAPVVLLGAVIAYLLIARPLDELAAGAPPAEELTVEEVRLEPGLIVLAVRADGSEPVQVAQIQIDGAYRAFTQTPPGGIGRLAGATFEIPYPWVEGEAHHIVLVTRSGATFEHTIEIAQATPDLGGAALWRLALVGLVLGVVPVAAGLLAYPALRGVGQAGLTFLLAVTIGLLAFLLIDTLGEGLEAASETLGRLNGNVLVWVVGAATALGLLMIGRRGGPPPEGIRLAFFVALGIGLHNLGEGLAVGASLATGAASLATYLVVGFAIHNVTEGIGIAAPMLRARPTILVFVGLAALAGLPAVAGVWAGSQAVSPLMVALAFAIGAGAILQVIVEIAGLLIRRSGRGALTGPAGAGGIIVGLAVMYGTALLV